MKYDQILNISPGYFIKFKIYNFWGISISVYIRLERQIMVKKIDILEPIFV